MKYFVTPTSDNRCSDFGICLEQVTMMKYFVTPTSDNRSEKWEKVYGRSHLPVKYPQPQLACTQRWGDVAVYYLDTTAVPEALLDRLATFEARRLGISYSEARMAVRQEWLIRAEGCQLEKELPAETPPAQLSLPFLHSIPFRPSKRKLRLKTPHLKPAI